MKTKPLTYAQQEAVRQMRDCGSLVHTYCGWTYAQTGNLVQFSAPTITALAKRGVLKIDRLIDGRETATLVGNA